MRPLAFVLTTALIFFVVGGAALALTNLSMFLICLTFSGFATTGLWLVTVVGRNE